MNPNRKAIEIVKLYAEALKKRDLPVRSVILFGSQARGQHDQESDIDVLVVTEKLDKRIHDTIIDEAYEISLKEEAMVIPLVCEVKEFQSPLFQTDPFYRSISREGIAIL